MGFSDHGPSPNHEKTYPLDIDGSGAIARQVLTVLYDVYGYDGLQKLCFETE